MNRGLVLRLIMKDWYLHRATLALIAVAGSLSVALLYVREETSSFVALSSAFIVIILLSILLPMQTVVNERKKQNLPFVMSLPISPMDYTTAKILGNLSAFVVLWLAIVIGVLGTIARAGLYGGVIPLALVAAIAPFVAFCLLLAVAIIIESELWAIVTQGACNVSYSFAWYFVLRVPGIREGLQSPVAVWSQPILTMLAVEVATIVLAIGLTFFFQSRKRDFI
jgi:ABC-2 type transport system permease protein